VDEDEALVGVKKVGRDIEGGSVGVGRNELVVESARTAIASDCKSNCVGAEDAIKFMVKREVSFPGRLTISTRPTDELKTFDTTIPSEDMVTFTVAFDVGRVVR